MFKMTDKGGGEEEEIERWLYNQYLWPPALCWAYGRLNAFYFSKDTGWSSWNTAWKSHRKIFTNLQNLSAMYKK